MSGERGDVAFWHDMYHHDFGVRATHWLMRFVTNRKRIALCTCCCDWELSPLGERVEESLFNNWGTH